MIQSNTGPGLYIDSSRNNVVLNNSITRNSLVGVYASGACTGTLIKGNTIASNGLHGLVNVAISQATGITFQP